MMILMLTSSVDEIKSRLDIVEVIRNYIKLQKAGANYRAVCPFHSEKKPSFFVSPARQIWHCFGCSLGGDIFGFVMKIEGVEFGDALRILARKAGVELRKEDPKIKTQRQRLYEISELACLFFEKQLSQSSAGREAKKYLLERGIKEETIKKWRLGYAPNIWQGLSDFLVSKGFQREEAAQGGLALKSEKTGNFYDRFRGRIIFPIFNLSSQPIGFGGRVFKEVERPDHTPEAKYINTPSTLLYDKSRILYGLDRGGQGIREKDECVLVEGYTDVVLANQAGFENVVATSGTALTSFQLKILKRYSNNLLTAFDMDIAGGSATKRGIDLAQASGFNIKVIRMPDGSDPADVISKDPGQWQDLVEKAQTIHDFYFEDALSKFDKNTLEGKKEISKILLSVIKRIPNKIEQTFWIQSLARAIEAKEEDILEELGKVRIDRLETGTRDLAEKAVVLPPKNRRELLEEEALLLLIKSPKNLDLIGPEEIQLFSSQTSQLVSCFKEKGLSQNQNLPPEFSDLVSRLSLRAEAEPFLANQETGVDFDFEKEFRNCLKEIKTLVVKDKLDQISRAIKRAEEEKNFQKAQELTQEFSRFSESLSGLESA